MPTTGIYDGSVMRLYVDDNATNTPTAIGYATTTTVSLSAEEVSITHKDNAGGGVWQEVKPKTLSGSISFEAFWAQTAIGSSDQLYNVLFGYFSNRTLMSFVIKTGVTGDFELSGTCYVTGLDATATDKEEATFSGTLSVTGAITQAAGA